jgi:hypothetical protein
MNRKLTQLAERRKLLIAQAEAQRALLTYDLAPWRERLSLADRAIGAIRYIRSHPALIVGAVLLVTALRPRHAGTWLQRGLLAWQIGRRLRSR